MGEICIKYLVSEISSTRHKDIFLHHNIPIFTFLFEKFISLGLCGSNHAFEMNFEHTMFELQDEFIFKKFPFFEAVFQYATKQPFSTKGLFSTLSEKVQICIVLELTCNWSQISLYGRSISRFHPIKI